MTCRLCLKSVPLVNSHVVSEFLYGPLYDEKHRFHVISTNSEINDRLRQQGLYEKLLCRDCDGRILSGHENYARGVLFGGQPMLTAVDGNNLRQKGLKYAPLKLFYLSLLWRMSISRNEFYKNVSLGPHEENIRRMLLASDPGPTDKYGLLCVAPVFDAQHVGDWMMPPDKTRAYGRTVYRCLIGGLLYCYFVGNSELPKPLRQHLLQDDGSWVIVRERVEKIPFLVDWCIEMGRAMQERQGRLESKR